MHYTQLLETTLNIKHTLQGKVRTLFVFLNTMMLSLLLFTLFGALALTHAEDDDTMALVRRKKRYI